jgi:hypothetical protein
MQVTTHQAGPDSTISRLALAQRIALAALAILAAFETDRHAEIALDEE